jgi:chitinase
MPCFQENQMTKRFLLLDLFFLLLFTLQLDCQQHRERQKTQTDSLPVGTGNHSPGMWITTYWGYWWQYGVPPWTLPWESITHVIHFDATYPLATPPYYHIDPECELGADGKHYQDSLLVEAHRYNVRVLLGFAFNNQDQVFQQGDAVVRQWAHNILAYAKTKGYDGIDLDLEPGPGPNQQSWWGNALQALHDTLITWNPPGILTVAVMQYFGEYFPLNLNLCDQVNMMEYDHAGNWNSGTGYNSPLYPHSGYPGGDDSSGIASWINSDRVPLAKLGFGVATYGRLYHGVTTPASKPNDNYGYRWYNDIVNTDMTSPTASITWDDISKVPYLSDPVKNIWITYDDSRSLQYKVDFAKRNGLGGFMIFGQGEGYLFNPSPGHNANELTKAISASAGKLARSSIKSLLPAADSGRGQK